jgi:predicted aspartyl protease
LTFVRIEGDVLSGRCLAPVYIANSVNFAHGIHLTALLDSGATGSAVTEFIAKSLSLPIVGSANVQSAAFGGGAINRYSAHLEFWAYGLDIAKCAIALDQVPLVTMVAPMSGIQLLIGMDILGAARSFQVKGDRWTITWDGRRE